MTNPNNIVRVSSRNNGRASVYEGNSNMSIQPYSQGLLSGNGVKQNTSADMNVLVGGSPSNPDIVIATAPSGYKIVLDIVGQQAIQLTAPASNSRITSVVAYTDDLSVQSTQTNVPGSPLSCGLILVNGTSAASPTAPSDSDIRSAITADGATGSQAAYSVIANITVASNTTTITNAIISIRQSRISTSKMDGGSTAGVLATDGNGNVTPRPITNKNGIFVAGSNTISLTGLVSGKYEVLAVEWLTNATGGQDNIVAIQLAGVGVGVQGRLNTSNGFNHANLTAMATVDLTSASDLKIVTTTLGTIQAAQYSLKRVD